ncbi:unnamed protein product, partial [Iphiclides podalirius]
MPTLPAAKITIIFLTRNSPDHRSNRVLNRRDGWRVLNYIVCDHCMDHHATKYSYYYLHNHRSFAQTRSDRH